MKKQRLAYNSGLRPLAIPGLEENFRAHTRKMTFSPSGKFKNPIILSEAPAFWVVRMGERIQDKWTFPKLNFASTPPKVAFIFANGPTVHSAPRLPPSLQLQGSPSSKDVPSSCHLHLSPPSPTATAFWHTYLISLPWIKHFVGGHAT